MAKAPETRGRVGFICGDIGDIAAKPWMEEVVYTRIEAAPGIWAWERTGEA